MDIHPVAVIIARVTYLLALAPALAQRTGDLSIPVYLGDSMQLSVHQQLRLRELVIRVPAPPGDEPEGKVNGVVELILPAAIAEQGLLFDQLVHLMRECSLRKMSRVVFEEQSRMIIAAYYAGRPRRAPFAPPDLPTAEVIEAIPDLGRAFETYDRLRQERRDTIWTYYLRNIARPLFFASREGQVQVLIGNPPWLAFRHMTEGLQKRFRELAKDERIFVAGKMATQNDLAALFVVRATGLYLRAAGRVAMVLPWAVLRGGQYAPFRTGSYTSNRIAWDEAWDLDAVEPLFPVPACVLMGRRRGTATATPDQTVRYSGHLLTRDASEAEADTRLKVRQAAAPPPAQIDAKARASAFGRMFRQGATLVPRMLCLVERTAAGPLGAPSSMPLVHSRRGTQDKKPWRDLSSVEGPIEAAFLRPVYLGESIAPFRVLRPSEGVLPVTDQGGMHTADTASTAMLSGLAGWMRKAEAAWDANQESDLSLTQRWDFHKELTAQFPIRPLLVVYAKAGTQPAACLIRDERAVIDHLLYWAEPASEDEAYYLIAILNSEEARGRIAGLQARGLFGARHFDKVMFTLPIPRFSAAVETHRALAEAGLKAETEAAAVALPEGAPFTRARRAVREALTASGASAEIDRLVAMLLDK